MDLKEAKPKVRVVIVTPYLGPYVVELLFSHD